MFDGARSRAGYRLNRLGSLLTEPANRQAFLADEVGYMRGLELDDAVIALVRQRDWAGLIREGGNIYLMLKIAGTVGQTLLQMGAQMRGESLEAFMATRPGAPVR
ncbi:MAG: protocatechuate 3,4-dioxygenase [Pseudomonadota bacterium]